MPELQFCSKCLYGSSHPLGLTFDSSSTCSGCNIHEEKNNLDWGERWKKLQAIVKDYRSFDSKYDCIVPVTAAQDSYFIMHLVKNKLGMKPLMVTYNKYFNTPIGINNLSNLRMKFNADILIKNVNPLSVKKIMRTTLREFGNIYWPNIAGQTVFPVEIAIKYKIPLIIWGAHQGIEQVGMFSHEQEVEMTRRYRKDHDLFGYEADDLLTQFDSLEEKDIWQYRYPDIDKLRSVDVRGIYLGNYVRWDPLSQHKKMVDTYFYKSAKLSRTFDIYDYIDCYNYLDLHDWLKFYKHGYSKITDHVSREIRHGRVSRQMGLFLIKKYETRKPVFESNFLEYLGLTKKGLGFVLDYHRNKNFWLEREFKNYEFNGWSAQRIISDQNIKTVQDDLEKFESELKPSHSLNLDKETSYITVGKGWP